MIANQLKNLIIGLFVIIACFIVVAIILFVKPHAGDGKQIIHVYFNDINGITTGTRVTYAGRPIGEVDCIQQIPEARQNALGGEIYPYLLTLKVDSGYVIYTTDFFTVQTAGLLGEKYVAIIPKPFVTGQVANIVTPKTVIYGESRDILQIVMDRVTTSLNRVIAWIDKYGDDLGGIAKNINSITTTIAKGKGTVGRLIQEDGLYLQLSALLTKTNTLLDDVNQYGLLFQYNKTWQRKRLNRMTEANYMRNSRNFQAYMDQQIDEMNTTISHMKDFTERLQFSELATNKQFRHHFAEFMQELNSLQEKVKLYNEELNEKKYKEEACP